MITGENIDKKIIKVSAVVGKCMLRQESRHDTRYFSWYFSRVHYTWFAFGNGYSFLGAH